MNQTQTSSAPFAPLAGDVRAIVVGMGGISGTMLKFLGQQPWYDTAAVVDIRPQALEAAKHTLELEDDALFTDLDRALAQADADAVIINTPSELHFAQAKAALKAGKHVLIAKPVTNDFQQALALVELGESVRRSVCVGQQMRYNRHYSTVRGYVATGALGSVEMMNFLNAKPRHQAKNLAKMDQPALYEMSCHHFDSILSIFPGQAPEWIMVDGFRPSWSVYAGPCSINGLIRFHADSRRHNSGPLHLLYHGGFSSQADLYELRLEGSEGALRCRGLHMSNDTMDYEISPRDGAWSARDLDEGIPPVSPWLPFFEHWHHYLAHGTLADGSAAPFSGRENLVVFAMLSAGIESIATGAPVTIAGNPKYAAAFS
jgi:predicted dehydrogenase